VSSLWTPDGEHRVTERPGADPGPDATPDAEEPGDELADDEDLDEHVAAVQAELSEVRQRLAETPVEVVVLNHAMGLYELAAIHLSNQPPNLAGAALAIDGFACLVEGLGERLGPEIGTLRDALSQIRLAFVQIKGAAG
jgi:hypothetical protein